MKKLLWDYPQLKVEIEHQALRVAGQRHDVAVLANRAGLVLRRRARAPRTLGLLFGAGFVYGMIGERALIPGGLRYLFWRGGSNLLSKLLAGAVSAAPAGTAPPAP